MKSDLYNPFIIKIIDNPDNLLYRQDFIDIITEIPESVIVSKDVVSEFISNTIWKDNNDASFWNVPYLLRLNEVERPIFSITPEDIVDTLKSEYKSDADKLRFFYMIFRHRKRHYGI